MVRYRMVAALLAATALAAVGRPAAAQPAEAAARRLAVNAGVLFPVGDTSTDAAFVVGLQYTFPRMAAGEPRAQFILSADWLRIDADSGGDATLVPVLLNYKWWFGGGPWYGGLGAGIIWADEAANNLSSDINFGWQAVFGREFANSRWFIEGRFVASDDPGDDGLLGAQIGFRF